MIIICENCQKKYKFDRTKLKSSKIAFQCKSCGHKFALTLPEDPTESNGQDFETFIEQPVTPPLDTPAAQAPDDDPFNALMAPSETNHTTDTAKPEVESKAPLRRYGLKTKMLLLFFGIPVFLVVSSSAIYLWQLESLTGKISVDSHAIVAKLSQERVNDIARMVATQSKLYLDAHPNLSRDDFNKDAEFKELAVQKVGETGYTCIYEIPDSSGKSGVWVHPNETIIGLDLPAAMKKAMSTEYQAWLNIYMGAYKGQTSSGYYKWKEKDGSLRDKYMTCVPVKGTPYIIAATTYVDEIYREAQALKATTEKMTGTTKMIVFTVFGITMLLMGGVVLFYSDRLRTNLTTLIDAAEKISVGELNTTIQVRSNDEISDLAEAIGRMQESIRLSIERLRRRR
jgi:HAMP domain-containing protein